MAAGCGRGLVLCGGKAGRANTPTGIARRCTDARFEILIRTHLADAWQLLDYASALRMPERHLRRLCFAATGVLGSGLIDHIQKMTMAAMAIADMKVWAQRSYRV
jgi:AraC-like DNA-binding protein